MSSLDERKLIDLLIDEFAGQVGSGESPDIEDYCAKHPELAAEIREQFPYVSAHEEEPFDDFKLLGVIGRGGMGVVYAARQKSLNRVVALKVIASGLASDKNAMERFRREARAIGRLHHSNIVPLFDVGEDKGRCYLAMQLIDGHGLEKVIFNQTKDGADDSDDASAKSDQLTLCGEDVTRVGDSGEMEPGAMTTGGQANPASGSSINDNREFKSIASIAMQVADALEYAHGRGVLHRDIKPSNILIDKNRVAWLTDFGLAKSEGDESSDLTTTGVVVGTVRYMAPEMFRKEGDARSDVYALGLTLYEQLTLRKAFSGSDRLRLMRMIDETTPGAPRSINSRIPRDLETIVMTAIEKEPGKRYQSARALADDLRAFIEDRPIQARRQSPMEQLLQWRRRNRSMAFALATIAALLLIATAGSIAFSIRQASLRETAEQAKIESQEARQNAIDALEIVKQQDEINQQNLYFNEMILAANALDKRGGIRRVRELTTNWLPTKDEKDRRGPEWHFLNGLGRNQQNRFDVHEGPVASIAFSPDDSRILTSGLWDNSVRIIDATDGSSVLEINLIAADAKWSPDGKTIALAGASDNERDINNVVQILDSSTGKVLHRFDCNSSRNNCVEFSPDGELIAAGADDGLRVWDVDTGKLVATYDPGKDSPVHNGSAIYRIDWHPKQPELLILTQKSYLRKWNVNEKATAAETWQLDQNEILKIWFGNNFVSWNPDGDSFVAGGKSLLKVGDSEIAENPAAIERIEPYGGRTNDAVWTADGKYLVTVGESCEVVIRDSNSLEPITSLLGHTSTITGVALSSDGKRIASCAADGKLFTWKFPEQLEKLRWTQGGLAMSPDGSRIAACDEEQESIRIFDIESERIISEIPAREGWTGYIAWSECGKRIASAFGDGRLNSIVDIHDVDTGDQLITIDVEAPYVQAIAWHPVEKDIIVVLANINSPLECWNAKTGERVCELEAQAWTWGAISWSPDGKWLGVAGITPSLIDWAARKTQVLLPTEVATNIKCACFSPDAKQCCCAGDDGGLIVCSIDDRKSVRKFKGHTSAVQALDWSPDATRLVSTGKDGTLKLWDAESGKQTLSLDLGSSDTSEVFWTPDGERIVLIVGNQLRVFRVGKQACVD